MEKKRNEYQPSDLNEFKLFLFIMFANVDARMELSEVNHLFERLDEEMFSSSLPDNELLVARVFKFWHAMSPAQRLDFVKKELHRYFIAVNDRKGAQRLIFHLNDLMMADGVRSAEELKLAEDIEKFLNAD